MQKRLVKRTSWAEAIKHASFIFTPASDTTYHAGLSSLSCLDGISTSLAGLHSMAADVPPHCSHCLTLAPMLRDSWRSLAGEAEFTCETDGSLYSWIQKERGWRREQSIPLWNRGIL